MPQASKTFTLYRWICLWWRSKLRVSSGHFQVDLSFCSPLGSCTSYLCMCAASGLSKSVWTACPSVVCCICMQPYLETCLPNHVYNLRIQQSQQPSPVLCHQDYYVHFHFVQLYVCLFKERICWLPYLAIARSLAPGFIFKCYWYYTETWHSRFFLSHPIGFL